MNHVQAYNWSACNIVYLASYRPYTYGSVPEYRNFKKNIVYLWLEFSQYWEQLGSI